MLIIKEFLNKQIDYVVMFFILFVLFFLVLLSIKDSENNPKILEHNGRYTYIKNLDKLFLKEKDFLNAKQIPNEDLYLYSMYLNINKYSVYKEKCDLNKNGDIIDFKFFNNVIGIKDMRHLYVDTKQLKKYNEKEIYNKLNTCLNYVISEYKTNKQIIPNKVKLIELISSKIKTTNN